ncbi:MAG: DegT/DnrJ/EryC1/StrS family aminotransferase [Candidatus Yanofskybacteria bacterium]|nr:DegT/DnrJ/EryC1/StrS family aminotransferase [Candidatus Yanofskybacteria bacterium]
MNSYRIRPISISLSPNTERDDILLAGALLFQLWRWKKGKGTELLEKEFANRVGMRHALSFNSGRSALMAVLHALNFEKGSEVALQAFTCNAVPNPVRWSGLTPLFIDCAKDDYNMDVQDLERKITPRTKAVIVQHTFGIPADMDAIAKICGERNLILIEDCAHALGATYKGKPVGTIGDISFFSFSRDKVISSVYGGMVATNNEAWAERVKEFQERAGYPGLFWIKQQLLHPVLMNTLVLPFYGIFGKYILVLFQSLHLFSKAVHWKEKKGEKPAYFPKRMPNALAVLALQQLKKLERFNQHRKEIAEFYSRELHDTQYSIPDTKYQDGSIFLRYPVRHARAHEIIRKAWKKGILLGDWYTTPIDPHDTKAESCGYVAGSCPIAEELSQETLNLPTHIRISKKDAERIIQFLRAFKM